MQLYTRHRTLQKHRQLCIAATAVWHQKDKGPGTRQEPALLHLLQTCRLHRHAECHMTLPQGQTYSALFLTLHVKAIGSHLRHNGSCCNSDTSHYNGLIMTAAGLTSSSRSLLMLRCIGETKLVGSFWRVRAARPACHGKIQLCCEPCDELGHATNKKSASKLGQASFSKVLAVSRGIDPYRCSCDST